MLENRRDLAVDACVLINLYASGSLGELVRALPYALHTTDIAFAECKYVRVLDPESQTWTRSEIDRSHLLQESGLQVHPLESGLQTELFVQFAERLDDGEATALALAVCREAPLASDDRVVRSVAGGVVPPVVVIGTAALIRQALERLAFGEDAIRGVLGRTRFGARFQPSETDPDYAWWMHYAPA